MSFRRRAGGGKRDDAEAAIVDALQACGVEVWRIGGTGNPDLLTRYRGIYTPLEVKTGKGTITPNQTAIPWPIVRDSREAFDAVIRWTKMQNEIKSVASGRPKG